MRGEVRAGKTRGSRATAVQAACRGGLDCRLGAGPGEERTRNMLLMYLTLDVSKLSCWLNADASCREPKGGVRCGARCGPRCGPRDGGQRATVAQAACRGGPDCRLQAGNGEERT